MARSIFDSMKFALLNNREMPTKIKTEVVKNGGETHIDVAYSCESWKMNEKHESRINAMKMGFLKRIQQNARSDKIRNETIRQLAGTDTRQNRKTAKVVWACKSYG